MIILSFDVDSVLLDTEKTILAKIKESYGKELTKKDVTHWSFYTENFPSIKDFFGNPELYKETSAVTEMVEIMEKVISKYGKNAIQLVTSSHSNIKIPKEEALKRHFGHIEGWDEIDIIHVGLKDEESSEDNKIKHHKHEHSVNTILIDDAIHNLEDHVNHKETNKGILIDYGYGWNQDYSHRKVERVTSPAKLLEVIEKMLKEV